jgi:hypothetical protein
MSLAVTNKQIDCFIDSTDEEKVTINNRDFWRVVINGENCMFIDAESLKPADKNHTFVPGDSFILEEDPSGNIILMDTDSSNNTKYTYTFIGFDKDTDNVLANIEDITTEQESDGLPKAIPLKYKVLGSAGGKLFIQTSVYDLAMAHTGTDDGDFGNVIELGDTNEDFGFGMLANSNSGGQKIDVKHASNDIGRTIKIDSFVLL